MGTGVSGFQQAKVHLYMCTKQAMVVLVVAWKPDAHWKRKGFSQIAAALRNMSLRAAVAGRLQTVEVMFCAANLR